MSFFKVPILPSTPYTALRSALEHSPIGMDVVYTTCVTMFDTPREPARAKENERSCTNHVVIASMRASNPVCSPKVS